MTGRRVMIGAPGMLAMAALLASGASFARAEEPASDDSVKIIDDVIEIEPTEPEKMNRTQRRRAAKIAAKAEQYDRSGHIRNIEKQRQKRGY